MILPQMEQSPLFNAINFSYQYSPWGTGDVFGVPVNSTVAAVALSAYVCRRTASNTPKAADTGREFQHQYSLLQLRGHAGVTVQPGCLYPACTCNVVDAMEGAMYSFGAVKMAGFTDGLSNTLLLGEVAGAGLDWFAAWMYGVQRVASAGINRPWLNAPGMCLLDPDQNVPQSGRQSVLGFGSYHPGGANFAFGDGSVKFLKDTTDLRVLSAGDASRW